MQKQQRVMAQMSRYCHDWRQPQYTTASLCPTYRRRARTAPPLPPPRGDCGCPPIAANRRPRKGVPTSRADGRSPPVEVSSETAVSDLD